VSNSRTILVTGGAGYIGSVVAAELIARGDRVIVFDNLCQGHRSAVPTEAVFIEGDLRNATAIDTAIAEYQPDAVMHFASHALVGDSMQAPFRYLNDNVVAGVNLFQAVIKHDVTRLIFSSTANLFANPAKVPISESEQINPGSPYGESKWILERMLNWLERIHGLRYAVLRYFNAAGATKERGECHEPETHLIPVVLEVAQGKRDQITIHGDDYPTDDGTCIRDFVHVTDLAQAHILALQALEKGSCVYHLGSGTGFSVKQVVETAREVTGRAIPFTIGPRRAGDPPILVADSEKIRRELGWNPQHNSLREIIASAWKWTQGLTTDNG